MGEWKIVFDMESKGVVPARHLVTAEEFDIVRERAAAADVALTAAPLLHYARHVAGSKATWRRC